MNARIFKKACLLFLVLGLIGFAQYAGGSGSSDRIQIDVQDYINATFSDAMGIDFDGTFSYVDVYGNTVQGNLALEDMFGGVVMPTEVVEAYMLNGDTVTVDVLLDSLRTRADVAGTNTADHISVDAVVFGIVETTLGVMKLKERYASTAINALQLADYALGVRETTTLGQIADGGLKKVDIGPSKKGLSIKVVFKKDDGHWYKMRYKVRSRGGSHTGGSGGACGSSVNPARRGSIRPHRGGSGGACGSGNGGSGGPHGSGSHGSGCPHPHHGGGGGSRYISP